MKQTTTFKNTALALVALSGMAAIASADELILTGNVGIVQSLDLDTGEVSFRGVCSGPVASMAVADGTLYLGTTFGFVWEYDLDTDQIVNAYEIGGDLRAMAWDGARLLIADSANTIITVDVETQAVLETRSVPSSDISAIGIDAGGLFVGGRDSLAFRAPIGQNNFNFFAACGSLINSMAFGPSRMYLAGTTFSGDDSGTVYLFDKFQGGVNYSNTFPTPNDASSVLSYGGMLYIGGSDGTIHEMDAETGDIVRTFEALGGITGIAPTQGLISCPADFDISGDLNFFDVQTFLRLFSSQFPAGDTNGDSAFDINDVVLFLDMFAGGCD